MQPVNDGSVSLFDPEPPKPTEDAPTPMISVLKLPEHEFALVIDNWAGRELPEREAVESIKSATGAKAVLVFDDAVMPYNEEAI